MTSAAGAAVAEKSGVAMVLGDVEEESFAFEETQFPCDRETQFLRDRGERSTGSVQLQLLRGQVERAV